MLASKRDERGDEGDDSKSLERHVSPRPGLVITWQPTKVKVGKSGEMAWVSGTYELTMNDASGKPINDRGKYLEVWEKQTDGNWKCAADMWNSDLAASAPAPLEK